MISMAELLRSDDHQHQAVIEVEGSPVFHLRHLNWGHTGQLYAIASNSGPSFRRYLGWPATLSFLDMIVRVYRYLAEANDEQSLPYCLVHGPPDAPRGVFGFRILSSRYSAWRDSRPEFDLRAPGAHIGGWVNTLEEGQGYARRAARALIVHAQKYWGVESVLADIAVGNTRAENSARACGFQPTGVPAWYMLPGDYTPPVLAPVSIDKWEGYDRSLNYARALRHQINHTLVMQKWLLRL